MRFTFLLLCCLLVSCQNTDGPAPPTEDVYAPPGMVEADRERHVWQKPGVVIEVLGDIEEKVIADIGAGEGFFARRLAPLADRVIAIEIDQRWIDYLDTVRMTELPAALQPRLEPRLALPDDPLLAENEVDIVLFVNTLYLIENQEDYLRKLIPALRPGGRVVIVDWKKEDTALGPDPADRIGLSALAGILETAGFEVVSTDNTTLDYQYIMVAEKK
ncbi:class I SAM-dependent methyltransferase [Neolewinella litorea]|uniref:Methyltransferase domain-containing protein n=1 Tax=Neolewinella litorea TaxID=2562452 RepID=A0A4S4NGG6_9BACT|nr:methyltransferase domain-containing protein [Neolewinella litorea]THH37915.1 methyltransferase domain-containing protein [Neolewinella litorea]